MNLKKVMKTIVAVLFCLAVVGIMIDICEGNENAYAAVGPIAAGCIIAFAIMDHTDRVFAERRKDSPEDNSEKA